MQKDEPAALTKSEMFILLQLDSVPGKIASSNVVRLAAQMSKSAYDRVLNRLEKRRFVSRIEANDESLLELTWTGMRAVLP